MLQSMTEKKVLTFTLALYGNRSILQHQGLETGRED